MALLTVQDVDWDGLANSYVAAAGGGDTFAVTNERAHFLHVKNAGAGSINVTLTAFTTRIWHEHLDFWDVPNRVVAVPAGGERLIGPIYPAFVGPGELASVSYSGVSSVTVAAFRLPHTDALVEPTWTPALLFGVSDNGFWWDFSDRSTLYQDSARTTLVSAAGDPVGGVTDKSGKGNHALQATGAARPVFRDNNYIECDGIDDRLVAALPFDQQAAQTWIFVGHARAGSIVNGASLCGYSASSRFQVLTTPVVRWATNQAAAAVSLTVTGTAKTLYSVQRVSSTVQNIWTDRTLRGSPFDPSEVATENRFAVGGLGSVVSAQAVNVYQALVINRVINPLELALAESYLALRAVHTLP